MRFIFSTFIMVVANLVMILGCDYGIKTWQWWAIMILMILYRLTVLIEN